MYGRRRTFGFSAVAELLVSSVAEVLELLVSSMAVVLGLLVCFSTKRLLTRTVGYLVSENSLDVVKFQILLGRVAYALGSVGKAFDNASFGSGMVT